MKNKKNKTDNYTKNILKWRKREKGGEGARGEGRGGEGSFMEGGEGILWWGGIRGGGGGELRGGEIRKRV